MAVVKREGKWRLEKEKDGLYSIKKRDKKMAEIITDDYKPQKGVALSGNPMMKRIEVKNFKEAKREFKNYIEKQEKNPFGL